jgi:hypothetical protein
MKSITKEYLADIIFRVINKSIDVHRSSKHYDESLLEYPYATDEEVLSFIHSIPYFDVKLKDFIIGQLSERTIIISQTWENEFIIKCRTWAESFEWLHGDDRFLSDKHLDEIRRNIASLSLPY